MSETKALYQASPFDAIRQVNKQGQEFWSARDLQRPLGYEQWRRFEETIERAIIACQNSGHKSLDHFADVGKMVSVGSSADREIKDYHLTRFACYLTAMNGDPRKTEIAAAQTYFALKTREAETAQPVTSAASDLETLIANLQTEVRRGQQALNHLKKARMLLGFSDLESEKPDNVLRVVKHLEDKSKAPTIRDLSRYLTRMDKLEIIEAVFDRIEQGQLEEDRSGKSPRYHLVDLQ